MFLFCFSIQAYAGQFHLLFIMQPTADKPTAGYTSWVVNSGGQEYYFMPIGSEKPEGYTVRDAYLVGEQGVYDMIYYYTRNSNIAVIGNAATEYAGGSKTDTAAAWVDFTYRSCKRVGVHSGFAACAAADIVLNAQWKDGGEWVNGSAGDWETAGFPADSATVNIGLKILGAD